MTEPTLVQEGIRLVSRWESAVGAVNDCKRSLNRAECELANATNELGKWMSPDDAQPGETFSVWHGAQLLTVTKGKLGMADYTISVRKRAVR